MELTDIIDAETLFYLWQFNNSFRSRYLSVAFLLHYFYFSSLETLLLSFFFANLSLQESPVNS